MANYYFKILADREVIDTPTFRNIKNFIKNVAVKKGKASWIERHKMLDIRGTFEDKLVVINESVMVNNIVQIINEMVDDYDYYQYLGEIRYSHYLGVLIQVINKDCVSKKDLLDYKDYAYWNEDLPLDGSIIVDKKKGKVLV